MPRYWYRIILGAEPVLEDFMSHADLGREFRPPRTARRERMYRGVSVYDTLDAAFIRLQSLKPDHQGIAALAITEGAFPIEQTTVDPRHHTVWAPAGAIEQHVHWILTVRATGRVTR